MQLLLQVAQALAHNHKHDRVDMDDLRNAVSYIEFAPGIRSRLFLRFVGMERPDKSRETVRGPLTLNPPLSR